MTNVVTSGKTEAYDSVGTLEITDQNMKNDGSLYIRNMGP